ncbi:unnamed protein product [Euphydryas editha]|uniref:THAP-type domain-containing protein n=1 Tax=Euphydryas editha TaxID=104508 RepID=A0AAU9U377_EUPED|nr:unnamed protein product [Euphydryas editha]
MTTYTGSLCAVEGCRSNKRKNKNLSFFYLPADEERRKTWTELIGRPDLASPKMKIKSHFVCSLHFDPSVITYTPKLLPDALPTKLLPDQAPEPTTSKSNPKTEIKEILSQNECSNVGKSLAATNQSPDVKSEATRTNGEISSSTRRRRKVTPRKIVKRKRRSESHI